MIYAHGLIGASVGTLLGRLFKKPCVVSLHTIYRVTDRHILANLIPLVFRFADRILVPSKEARNEIMGIGISPSKTAVYTYWINEDTFDIRSRQESRERLGLTDGFLALFVGRFIETKGVRLVLKTAQVVRNVTFLFVGEGPLRAEIEEASAALDNVILVGPVSNNQLPLYYNAADVLVWANPDMDYYGRVTIEALMCGLSVIGPNRLTAFGVSREASVHAEGFKLIDPDHEELAKILFQMVKGSTKLSREKIRKNALRLHSEKNAEVITSAYQETLQTVE